MAIGNRAVCLCLNWLNVSNHEWVHYLEWTFADAIPLILSLVGVTIIIAVMRASTSIESFLCVRYLFKGCLCIILINPQIALS